LEKAQRDGVIANPLEATVHVVTDDPVLLAAARERLPEIEELLILSNFTITEGNKSSSTEKSAAASITIGKTEAAKCDRCWRHREEVGAHAEHPTLCGRCVEAVESIPSVT
jgi:isoleucyl-tRNA synthetase